MIKANELRLGNTIEFHIMDTVDGTDEWVDNTVDIGDLQFLLEDPEDPFHRPKALTEEWLLEFGFEKHESLITNSYSVSISKNKEYYKTLVVTISQGNEYIHIREGENPHPSTADTLTTLINGDYHGRPFYVHQLQNLYFALTGEELVQKCELTTDETPIK